MGGERQPRVVVVTRPTALELLVAEHGTLGQARFVLGARGRSMDDMEAADAAQRAARATVLAGIDPDWRRAEVDRADLDRFLFAPDDLVVCVGQDGLVANVAKYLTGQPVVGVNPDPAAFDGVLVRHTARDAGEVLREAAAGHLRGEARTLVQVVTVDGQRLRALNELFLGHRTHQSARYLLRLAEREERQSSSGVICATGTGATGWARSIARERADARAMPAPDDPALVFYVREAFPSVTTGTDLTSGIIAGGLTVVSEMDDGVIFGDGVESDAIVFTHGMSASLGVADDRLNLV